MQLLFGLDVGTTALKAAVFDINGNLLGVSTQEYALETPKTDFVEVEAETYWSAFKAALAEIRNKHEIKADDEITLAISAQGETLICIDKEGKPLRKAIVWMDNRAHTQAEAMEERFGNELAYKVTGQVSFEPCWPAPKLLWIKENEPEVFEKTYKFLLVEDYLLWRMTGKFYTEGSLVTSSMYWDITKKVYWKDMLDFIGIDEDRLAPVAESGVMVGEILPEVRAQLGIPCRAFAATGALDQACGAIGGGVVKEGMFSETIGAALAICVPVSKPVFDPNQKMPLHYFAIPDTYMIHTFTTGGMTLRWFRDKFCAEEMAQAKAEGKDAYDIISGKVSSVPAGCEGLVMLPHLSGSLAPDVNSKAKGVWFGFGLNHTKAHFARAIMESLAFILRRNLEALSDMGISVKEIRSLGGGSKSSVWNQIKADVNDVTLMTVKSKEAACLGAAILAGTAAGIFSSVADAAESMVQVKERYTAVPDDKPVYDKNFSMYCKLFKDLTESFDLT